jgi:hypothetical protein
MRFALLLVVFFAVAACGHVAAGRSPDAGARTCVLDKDTMDDGCTLEP